MGQRPATVGVLVGNPRAGSRTATVALEVARQVASAVDGNVGPVVDLADHGPAVLDPEAAAVQSDMASLSAADVLVVASPTYKATYTGLLKAFFDRFFGSASLAGIVAVPVMVGGAPQHAMAGEVHLRPLLVELGCVVPTRSLYVMESELDHLGETVRNWLTSSAGYLAAALGVPAAEPHTV